MSDVIMRIEELPDEDGFKVYRQRHGVELEIAECDCIEHAKEVLRAVNAHDDLVAALRFVGSELAQRGQIQSTMMDRINSALAKAEGK